MSGATGSSFDAGNHGNGAVLPQRNGNDPPAHAQTDQVNIVCPTCGSIPSEGLKQYSNVSASGHSNNVFGDVQNQIFYCSSHCAHHVEYDSRGSDTRAETSSRAAPPPSPTRQLSRTHTLDSLPPISERLVRPVSHGVAAVTRSGCEVDVMTGNNNGGPGSAAEPSSLSLIGLKAVRKSTTDQGHWEPVYSAKADFARLDIQDAHIDDEKLHSNHEYPFVALAREWAACAVSIEAHRETGFRRLKIEEGDACEVWVPETRVQVISHQSTVSMRFSNCNKLQPPGHYPTQDGTAMSVATYHPEKPNVIFEVGFTSIDTAGAFRKHVLRRDMIDKASDGVFEQDVAQTTMFHSLRDTETEKQKPCIFLWKEDVGTENDSLVQIHDVVAISDRFDISMIAAGEEMNIAIGFVDRLTYFPAFDQPDLPQNVKRTLDGAPTKSNIEGGDLASSKLCLTTAVTEASQLVNYVLSKTIPWKLEAIFHQIDVKVSSSKKLKIGKTSYMAQLTLWSDTDRHTIRISMRTSDTTDTDQDAKSEDVKWFSITLIEGESIPTANLKQKVLIIDKIDCENGDCLSTRDLRPRSSDVKSDANEDSNNTNSIALELNFGSADAVTQFRKTVTNRFLRVADS